MIVEESNPFPNSIAWLLDFIGHSLMRPFGFFLDHFFSCFMHTTRELKKPYIRYPHCIVAAPILLLLSVVTLPLGISGYLLWWLVCHHRLPYRTSILKIKPKIPDFQSEYSIATINTCLIQELLARFNNVGHSRYRSTVIGQNIANQQLSLVIQNQVNGDVRQPWNPDRDSSFSDIGLDYQILTELPPCDFLLFQECWLIGHSRRLAKELHRVYPYIVYDVGEYGVTYINNSGLMVASRHPILEIRFRKFSDSCKQCKLASKGCLQMKVHLGNLSDGRRLVGLIHNTHLQAYQGTEPIHDLQMSELVQWAQEFREQYVQSDDVVIFDIQGGDFNADNMSPVNESDWDHPLFKEYIDVCRVQPGKDQPWAIGTDMRQLTLQDDLVQTPHGLKKALEDDVLRQYYIIDADITNATPSFAWKLPSQDEKGEWVVSPVGGKRRIDFLLVRKASPVNVMACNPVTQLAGLTDHVIYSLTMSTHLPAIKETS